MKKSLKDMPSTKASSTLHTVMTVLIVVEFILAVGGYMLLKTYVSSLWAELWMLVLFAIELKNGTDLIESKIKEQLDVEKTHKNGEDIDESKEGCCQEDSKERPKEGSSSIED